jgi:hypothetical protein
VAIEKSIDVVKQVPIVNHLIDIKILNFKKISILEKIVRIRAGYGSRRSLAYGSIISGTIPSVKWGEGCVIFRWENRTKIWKERGKCVAFVPLTIKERGKCVTFVPLTIKERGKCVTFVPLTIKERGNCVTFVPLTVLLLVPGVGRSWRQKRGPLSHPENNYF